MAKNAELSRLKAALVSAQRDKQRAWERQNFTWQHLLLIKAHNNDLIKQLNTAYIRVLDRMQMAHGEAATAFAKQDHASTRAHATNARRHRAQAATMIEGRRKLVEEIRSATIAHREARDSYRIAKATYALARQHFFERLMAVRAEEQREATEGTALRPDSKSA